MVFILKVSTRLILLLTIFYTHNAVVAQVTEDDPLIALESNQDVVLKNKNNKEATYTFGYENDDGIFKYESRDVVGNVKGNSFGFISNQGDLKKLFDPDNKTSVVTSDTLNDEINQNPEVSTVPHTTTTKRSSTLVYPHVTLVPSPTRSAVIQSIPRRRTTTSTTPPTTTTSTTTESPKPIYGHYIRQPVESSSASPSRIVYATSQPTRFPLQNSPHTRPILQNGQFVRTTIPPQEHGKIIEGQLIRPSTHSESTTTRSVVDNGLLRRILVSRNPLQDSTTESSTLSSFKPILEDLNEKELEKQKRYRSNTFRRQLSQEKDFDPQQHIINYQQSAGEDSTDIYGSSVAVGTQRPLFTTTQGPRVIPAPRTYQGQEQVEHIQYRPIGYRRNFIRVQRPNHIDNLAEAPTTQTPIPDDEPYQTPGPVPILQIPAYRDLDSNVINQSVPRHRQFINQRVIPANRLVNQELLRANEEGRVDADPRLRFIPYQNEQYLREASATSGPLQFPPVTPAPYFIRQRRPIPRPVPLQYDEQDQQYLQDYPNPVYPVPVPVQTPSHFVQNLENELQSIQEDIKPPISTRDFQRLLNQLIFVQSRLQQLIHRQGYTEDPRNYPQPQQAVFNPRYQPVYQPQLMRRHPGQVPVENSQNNPNNRLFVPVYQNQVPQNIPYETVPPYDPRYVVRRRPQYPNQFVNNPQEYLPPEIREMLLLKMLQLAINAELAATNQMEVATVAPKPRSNSHSHSPIRNVKIIGEESEGVKSTVRSKRYNEREEVMDYYE